MDLSARSEPKSELAESRIETKLRINKCGLLHVCLTDVRNSHAGALMLVMQQGPRCAAGAYDRVGGDAGTSRVVVGCRRMRSGEALGSAAVSAPPQSVRLRSERSSLCPLNVCLPAPALKLSQLSFHTPKYVCAPDTGDDERRADKHNHCTADGGAPGWQIDQLGRIF